MAKKIIGIASIIVVLLITFIVVVSASENLNVTYTNYSIDSTIDPSTNFFTQQENTEQVAEVENDEELIEKGYTKISENEELVLYVNKTNMAIALYQKAAKYIWYSSFRDIDSIVSSKESLIPNTLNSGVIIECFDSTTLNDTKRYSADPQQCKLEFENITNGFKAHVNFYTSGISFDVNVTIDGYKLNVNCDLDTLKEVPYKTPALKYPKDYKLESISVFPYFGCENYEINGYAFIPDGSGALIRYENKSYITAYIKRVYGNDPGLATKKLADYLKNQNDITLPIFGINHGYNQAAFLCEINQGMGSCELRSYPYAYENINLNRTFFKFIARDKFNVQMATSTTGALTLINSEVYTSDYTLTYSFLSGTDANYIGMAKEYKKNFDLQSQSNASIKLDVLAQDYKPGLFGKNYIVMTRYQDLKNIIKDLFSKDITQIRINYIGYNNNGYVDNTLTKIKTDSSLGSKKDFQDLVNYLSENNIDLSLYNNPIVAKDSDLGKKTIKMQNLEQFIYTYKSSIDVTGKYINPNYIYEYFNKNKDFINKYNLKSFTFAEIGSTSFSYRYKGDNTPREDMIKEVQEQLQKIKNNDITISLSRPNNYLFNYIDNYYDANYESSRYAFITDSIPFISLVLSGSVNMYSSNINYVSNYNVFILRLIEYNIYPSYMITKDTTSKLRYANYEYLYTTEFVKWEQQIIDSYQKVVSILSNVNGAEIVSHKTIEDGIVEIKYSNNYVIYVNYTNQDYIYNTTTIPAMGYIGGAL